MPLFFLFRYLLTQNKRFLYVIGTNIKKINIMNSKPCLEYRYLFTVMFCVIIKARIILNEI